ncbi:hypothetical protein PRIEUP_LOCUS8276, partial [Pristimantis euphronides]
MEALRSLFHVRDHPSWRKMSDTWYQIIFPHFILTKDFSSVEYKEWNPWSDWCNAWENFQSSKEKPPKSEKLKAAIFSQLYTVAKLTSDKLEEGKIKAQENQSLIYKNVELKRKCDELQRQLDAERQVRMENDYWVKLNLEKEAKLKETLEDENELLTSQVKQTKRELEKTLARCRELENMVSEVPSLLEYCSKRINYQINIKNDINVLPSPTCSPSPLHGQLENGEVERCLDCINDIASRLGKVTSLNVFDWLCRFEGEYNILKWNENELEEILLRCMDSGVFTSLLPLLNTGHLSWLDICIHIAERFIPDLDDILTMEKMEEDEKVLDYFHRMWMIYRVTRRNGHESKNDPEYLTAICVGLLPHLYKEVEHICDGDYQSIERAAISAEYSSLVFKEKKSNWYKKARKAGVGCPSRMSIWKRLEKYPELYKETNNAIYFTLLVHLSRVEDL